MKRHDYCDGTAVAGKDVRTYVYERFNVGTICRYARENKNEVAIIVGHCRLLIS